MKENLFYIGLALIAVSFISCVMSFYLLIFGIPIFLIGATLVLLSKRSTNTKLLTTLIPLVLYIPFTFLFLYLYNYSTPKAILIPADFDGNLRVVYEEKCGIKYLKDDGLKTLSFLKSEILILSEDFDRHINYKCYLVDGSGTRTEIRQIDSNSDSTQKLPYILFRGSGTIGQTVEANSTNLNQGGIAYTDFYVYNKDSTTKRNKRVFKKQQEFNSMTRKVVDECRSSE